MMVLNACPQFTNILDGKSLKLITKDGPVLEYDFNKKGMLTLSEDGGKKNKGCLWRSGPEADGLFFLT